MLKKFAASMVLAIAALVATVSLAHADALDDIKKAGKIRIAIDLGVPPYGMTDDKLQPTGLDVETARLLAKHWGLEFEHVPTTGASRIPALQTGKADLVISSLSYTTERAKVIDFSLGYAVLRNCHRRAARPLGLSSGPTVPAFDARFAFLRSTDVELECC